MSTKPTTVLNDSLYRNIFEDECDSDELFNISLSDAQTYRYQSGQIMLVTVILPTIFGFGMIGNVAFIYIAVRIKQMRTITNRYLVNLSISDVLFLAAAIGEKLWKYISSPIMGDDSPFGSFGCIWVYFVSDMAYFASLIFVTIVSLDRYFAVCRPQDRKHMIKTRPHKVTLVSWTASGILAASLVPSNAQVDTYCFVWPSTKPYVSWKMKVSLCAPLTDWIADLATGIQTVPFFISLVLNVYLYIGIIRGLDQSIKRMSDHGVSCKKDKGTRRQIAKMLVVNGATFFCLLVPFELVSLFRLIASIRGGAYYTYLLTNDLARSYIMLIARMLSYINSAINPIIYTVMCRRYRDAFKHAFVPNVCRRYFSDSCRNNPVLADDTNNQTCDAVVTKL